MRKKCAERSTLEPAHKFSLRSFTLTQECPAASHAGLLQTPLPIEDEEEMLLLLAPLRRERKVVGRSVALVFGREWLPSYLILCHSRTRTIGRYFRERSALEPAHKFSLRSFILTQECPAASHAGLLTSRPFQSKMRKRCCFCWLPCGGSEKLSGEA